MAWLWDSWEEYVDYVGPICLDGPSGDIQREYSWFEIEATLLEVIEKIQNNLNSLNELGFTGEDNKPLPEDPSILDEVDGKVIDLTHAGEKLLLYHKRLAQSKASYEFLSSHTMYDHWERYATTRKIFKKIHELVKGSKELINGYYEIIREDDKFLLRNLDLPKELEDDFILSRNLFSIGFDEVGVLIVGRGLEGVLRKIAKSKKNKYIYQR